MISLSDRLRIISKRNYSNYKVVCTCEAHFIHVKIPKLKTAKLFWRINENIRSPEVRVIGADGKQLGVMKSSEALTAAKKQGLTLVEIAPTAKPPVAKIVDFGKFRYQEEKKQRREAKKAKAAELKEVRFSPFIAENDFQTRFGRVKEFLGEKNKVRLVVAFRGPQMRSKKFGYDLLARMLKELGDTVVTDMQPKFLGKHLMMIVSPLAKRITRTTTVVSEQSEVNHAKTENKKINN